MVNGYTIPTYVVDNKTVEKPYESWSEEEIKKGEYDSKEMNIIHSSLNFDEFFRVSACTNAKEIWDLIQVIHEGTSKENRARKNSLIQEYENFRMNDNCYVYAYFGTKLCRNCYFFSHISSFHVNNWNFNIN